MDDKKFDLAIAIALVPILGTGLVLVNQLGRFVYYGIPAEFLGIDAYKVLVSSISMWLLATAMIYTGATFHSLTGTGFKDRALANLGLATVITAPFWVGDVHWARSISWITVAFVGFTGLVFYLAERWLRRESQQQPRERIAGWALTAFLASLGLLTGTFAFGFIAEQSRTYFPFIAGSDQAVLGTAGDLLIVKAYDRQRRCFDRETTTLLPVDGAITLVSKNIARGPAAAPANVCSQPRTSESAGARPRA